MSEYNVMIICEKCRKQLAEIHSRHHGMSDALVPQDIHDRVIEAEWIYCDDCLNSGERTDEQNK